MNEEELETLLDKVNTLFDKYAFAKQYYKTIDGKLTPDAVKKINNGLAPQEAFELIEAVKEAYVQTKDRAWIYNMFTLMGLSYSYAQKGELKEMHERIGGFIATKLETSIYELDIDAHNSQDILPAEHLFLLGESYFANMTMTLLTDKRDKALHQIFTVANKAEIYVLAPGVEGTPLKPIQDRHGLHELTSEHVNGIFIQLGRDASLQKNKIIPELNKAQKIISGRAKLFSPEEIEPMQKYFGKLQAAFTSESPLPYLRQPAASYMSTLLS